MFISFIFIPELVGVPSILYSCWVLSPRKLVQVNVPAFPPSEFSYQLKNAVSCVFVAAYDML